MFRNYMVIAWRNFWKNKTFSFINTTGLALGMACSLFIMLWVIDEKSVDGFHKFGDRLYSVYERQYYDNSVNAFHGSPGVLAEEMKKKLPEVELASQLAWNDRLTFSGQNKILKFDGNSASPDFFRMFSYPLLQGSPESALATPVSLAISKKMAISFFGSPEKAMGQSLRFEDTRDLKVTAVFDDFPRNSSLQFDYLLNWDYFLERNGWAKEWGNNGPRTLIVLKAGTDAAAFEKKITKFLDAYNKEQNASFYIQLGIQRFRDMYLHSTFKEGRIEGGRIEYVRIFSVVAIFILVIACINFMNLTTARSVKRSKEIGIRKVVGALRVALIRQFLGEAVFMSVLAAALALLLGGILLPVFNQLTGKQIDFPIASPLFWLIVAAATLGTGLIAGSYPALFLSAFHPIRVLKGQLKFRPAATWFRKGLVVFQFVLSTILIVGTIVVSRQINYISNTNLGYDRENLLYIPFEGQLASKYQLLKERALHLPGIKSISRSADAPTNIENGTGGVEWEGKDPNVIPMFTQTFVGYDFMETMDIKMLKGRDFSRELASDSAAYIINESAAKKMSSYKDPVGKPITFWGEKGYIIGVIKDFHFNSLHLPINPLILRLGENESWGTLIVRTKPGETKQALASLQDLLHELNPNFPFTYDFADEEYRKLYAAEQTIGQLSGYFAFLAIFISCLGLLGLTMFTAEQRLREFGIRKVLGANVANLFNLLSGEFMLLISVAMIIAFPVAWWLMHNWLRQFSYNAGMDVGIFFLAAVISIAIALGTISIHALKAAFANPVKSLRTE